MLDTCRDIDRFPENLTLGLRVGQLVGITPDGRPLVDFAENLGEAVVARATVCVAVDRLQRGPLDVLLVFEDQDRTRPIVVGILADTIVAQAPTTEVLSGARRGSKSMGRRRTRDAHRQR